MGSRSHFAEGRLVNTISGMLIRILSPENMDWLLRVRLVCNNIEQTSLARRGSKKLRGNTGQSRIVELQDNF